MTPPTPTATKSNGPPPYPGRPTSSETRPGATCRQRRREDADRAFEAGVRWFLAISAAA